MTRNQIRTVLNDAISTGKIGDLVSVRVHAQLPGLDTDLAEVLSGLVEMVSVAFPFPAETLRSRSSQDGNQWNVLIQSENGRTLFVTVGRGSAKNANLSLLVVGNHGVIRLESHDEWEFVPDGLVSSSHQSWREAVEQSHQSARSVPLTY
jgi:hypothetical protein